MRLRICSGLLFASSFICLNPALAADPTGDWRVADGLANIRIAECSGSMWGVVSWEKSPGGRDDRNSDVSKRNRPVLGMPVLLNMKKKADAEEWVGQVYNAQDGQIYDSTITPTGPDQLEIKGCVLGFLCGGETWTRVGPPIPLSPSNNVTKGAPKATAAALPKPAPKPAASATAAKSTTPKGTPPVDAVGDICLLSDIAGFAH